MNIRIRGLLGCTGAAVRGDLIRHTTNYVPHDDLVNGMRGTVVKCDDHVLIANYYGTMFGYPVKSKHVGEREPAMMSSADWTG